MHGLGFMVQGSGFRRGLRIWDMQKRRVILREAFVQDSIQIGFEVREFRV